VYVKAFLTILMIEKTFGAQLRDYAIRIRKERYVLRQQALSTGFQVAADASRNRVAFLKYSFGCCG